MKLMLTALFIAAPMFAQAQTTHIFMDRGSSCSARSIDEFYCPDFATDFQGPYFDLGCSVKCSSGKKAVCREAHCDDDQNGQPIYSKCSCD